MKQLHSLSEALQNIIAHFSYDLSSEVRTGFSSNCSSLRNHSREGRRGSSNGEGWEFWKREAAKQELKAGDRWYEAVSKGKWEDTKGEYRKWGEFAAQSGSKLMFALVGTQCTEKSSHGSSLRTA